MKQNDDTTTSEKTQAIQFPGDLRDWLAGQALAGMNASPELLQFVTSKADGGEGLPFERMARKAYEQADAMIAARKPKEAP